MVSDLVPHVLCLTLLCIIVSLSTCTVQNERARMETAKAMQANGAEPLDIPCATNTGTERYCELRAATKVVAQ